MNREEAIKRIRDFGLYHAIEDLPFSTKTVEAFEMAIQALKEPERKRGKWIDQYQDGDWHCSCCGAIVEKEEQILHNWYFCYHCGADMREAIKNG